MIHPTEFNNTQNLAFVSGSANVSDVLSNNPGASSNDLLEPDQQVFFGDVYLNDTVWKSLLFEDRVRPYIDLTIFPPSKAVRLPIAVDEYDVYADKGTFYEDVLIKGNLTIEGDIFGNFRFPKTIRFVDQDITLSHDDQAKLLHIEPAGESVTLTLPNSGVEVGFFVEIINAKEGSFTHIICETGELKAKHDGLSQRYSAATVYWTGTDWYAIGDLTAI